MANYPHLTFNTLYEDALALIKSKCQNVNSYESINEAFTKIGYKKNVKISGEGKKVHTITATATIVDSTRIVPVSADVVTSDFRNYMINTKRINLEEQVTTNKLSYFLNCLSAFIQTKLRVAGTDTYINSGKVTFYLTSSTSFPTVSEFREYEDDSNYNVYPFVNDRPPDTEYHYTVNGKEVIRASDVNSVLDILNKVLNKNVKPYVVKYSYSYSTT